ncbi:MAG: bifunctional oligoribonuclease/PAP phosphatase NrnA [Verrucomicrobiae bacterium]|nr:bifunctional oligoribonuclease/PAP phosphatase NrnA [Verrucomicrobiae bacterium]
MFHDLYKAMVTAPVVMRKTPRIVQRIIEAINQAETICVAGHVRPDGDCIGAQLGLALAIRNLGKRVSVWNEDPIPDKLAFLDPEGLLERPHGNGEFDCVITVDSASYERLGTVTEHIKNRRVLINIDHHPSNTRFGDINWVRAREPSTGELVFRLIKYARWPITPRIADCLFTAVSTDTGSFQYPTTRPTTFVTAGELVKRGANLGNICREVYQSFPLSRVKLLRYLFSRFRLTHKNQIAYFWLRPADFARSGADPADAEGLIDHLRAIEPVVVACVFEQVEPELIRVSFRSKRPSVDVSLIASQFGGGGHTAAAGARIAGPPRVVQRKVLAAIRRAINSAK